MPLSDEQKQKMADGRRRALEAKKAAKAARDREQNDILTRNPPTPSPSPAPAVPTPAVAPLAAAGGRGLVPTMDEIAGMRTIYETLAAAGAMPQDKPGDKGKPLSNAQAMALMLKGWELGCKPIESLSGLYIADDGLIAQKADLMRSRIQKSGVGVIVPVEQTPNSVVLEGTRYGQHGRADKVHRLPYSIQDLQVSGGLTESARKNLIGTLFARATGMLARMMFADVLGGACYTPEELQAVTVVGGNGTTKPEAVAAPETAPEPAPAPTPTPPAPEPQIASPAQPDPVSPPAERTLTTAFQIIAPGGAIQEMRTAGVTKPIMEAIMALAATSPDMTAMARAGIARAGQKFLRYLNAPEGETLLAELQATRQGKPVPVATPDPGGSAELALRTVAQEFGVDPELVLRTVASSFDVEDVSKLSMAQGIQAVKEIRHAARDPQALALLLGRATG